MKLNDVPTFQLSKIGEEIDKGLAGKMVKDYQDTHPTGVKSYLIGREILERILNQPGCSGIRFYNALNEIGRKTLVYVGIDENEQIISEIPSVNETGRIEIRPAIVADRVVTGDKSDDHSILGHW